MIKEGLSFYRASDGAPRAKGAEDAYRVLARFLESDLQDDALMARELLDRLSETASGDDQVDAFIGNAFAVTVDEDTVTLAGHAEGNDQTAMLSLEKMQDAVRDWLAFVSD